VNSPRTLDHAGYLRLLRRRLATLIAVIVAADLALPAEIYYCGTKAARVTSIVVGAHCLLIDGWGTWRLVRWYRVRARMAEQYAAVLRQPHQRPAQPAPPRRPAMRDSCTCSCHKDGNHYCLECMRNHGAYVKPGKAHR